METAFINLDCFVPRNDDNGWTASSPAALRNDHEGKIAHFPAMMVKSRKAKEAFRLRA
jgi:hypothetical protein